MSRYSRRIPPRRIRAFSVLHKPASARSSERNASGPASIITVHILLGIQVASVHNHRSRFGVHATGIACVCRSIAYSSSYASRTEAYSSAFSDNRSTDRLNSRTCRSDVFQIPMSRALFATTSDLHAGALAGGGDRDGFIQDFSAFSPQMCSGACCTVVLIVLPVPLFATCRRALRPGIAIHHHSTEPLMADCLPVNGSRCRLDCFIYPFPLLLVRFSAGAARYEGAYS